MLKKLPSLNRRNPPWTPLQRRTWLANERREHRLQIAPVLRGVYSDLLQWDWDLPNPYKWNVWMSMDGGNSYFLVGDYWGYGDARQFAPDGGGELYYIVGIDETGREITKHSNIVRPDDAPVPMTLLTDLIAYWDGDSDLDETANLSLLPEADPTYSGSGGPDGGPACALGSSDSVYSEDEAFFNYTGMTFNAWVNQNEANGVETLSERTADQWTGVSISLFVALDSQIFGLSHAYSATEYDGPSSWLTAPYFVGVGEWHMWTITMNASRMDLYLDGAWLGGFVKTQPTYRFPTAQFRVKGNHPFGAWSGSWANLGLWHRALGASEVASLFNFGSGKTYTQLL